MQGGCACYSMQPCHPQTDASAAPMLVIRLLAKAPSISSVGSSSKQAREASIYGVPIDSTLIAGGLCTIEQPWIHSPSLRCLLRQDVPDYAALEHLDLLLLPRSTRKSSLLVKIWHIARGRRVNYPDAWAALVLTVRDHVEDTM